MEGNMNAWREETMSSQVTTAACRETKEPNPEDMKSEVEHQEVHEEVPLCSSGRSREHRLQRQGKDYMAQRTLKVRTSRMKRRKGPECKMGIKDPGT
jgi:hypothetical protein